MRSGRLALALGLLLLGSTPALAEDPPPESPLTVTVSELLPRAPQPGDAFEVVGTVRNDGPVAVRKAVVRLQVGDRIDRRGGLHDADTDRPVTQRLASKTTQVELGELAPGARVRFDIRTTVDALGLGQLGVYPLDVEARGDVGDGTQRLGLAPTWVPWFAGDPVARTQVAVVLPLVDRPRQLADGSFEDEALADALSARLSRIVATGNAAATRECGGTARSSTTVVTPAPTRCEPVGVTWAVDPDLVASAAALAADHRVGRQERPPVQAAKDWLGTVRSAVRGGSVLALPYADPDVTALTRASSFRDDLTRAAVLASAEVRGTLDATPLTTVAWPPTGAITTQGLQALAQTGADAFVLDPSAFGQPDNELSQTPASRTLLPGAVVEGGTATGLVTDGDLSALLSGSLATTLGPRLAEQRFLAETAILAAQKPRLQRAFVLALDRRGDVVVGAAANALRDLGRVPWLCPVSLTALADGTQHCADEDAPESPSEAADRGPLSSARGGQELPATELAPVALDRDVATQLTESVLSDQPEDQAAVTRIASGLRRSIARAESSAWRTDPRRGRRWAGSLHRQVADLAGRVTVYGGQVLLTSTSGRLQVSLENRLDVPIRVRVRFEDTARALQPVETPLISVTPGNAVPAVVTAQTRKSGQYVVQATVVDRAGNAFPRPVGTLVKSRTADVVVRSTGYGRVALAVTIGGAGVLFVAAGLRIVRRARAAGRAARS